MKFDLDFERIYPQTVEQVWAALTDKIALGAWLMETDFVEQAGHGFRMWCDDGDGGTDTYICKVLELDKPQRMLWLWALEGKRELGETRVEFILTAVENGTRLTIRHSGDLDPEMIKNFKSGWPAKIEQLGRVLSPA